MSISVEVPDKGTVEFPDGTNPRDIEHALFTQWPDLADTPQKQAKAALLAKRDELLHKAPFGIPEGELQQAVSEGLEEGLTTPFAKIPRPPSAGNGTMGKVIDAVADKLIGAVESVESPLGVGLLATGGLAPKVATAAAGLFGAAGAAEGTASTIEGIIERDPGKIAGGLTDAGIGVLVAGGAATRLAPKTAEAVKSSADLVKSAPVSELVPESRRLMAPRTRMPEFTESTLEPGGPPRRALPAPGESEATAGLLPESPIAPRTAGYRIELPVEPETAKAAREVWANPIDVEAEVTSATDALRKLASMTEETKTPGEPYQPPTVNVDLRQLERMMQRNTVSKVESWADEVIQDKMRGASSNPYLDPEFLAAALAKGAILFKRGVTEVAEWNKAMREQFGVGIQDALPKIYQQSKDFWESRSGSTVEKTTTGAGPGVTGMGGATPSEFPTEPPPLSRAAAEAASTLAKVRQNAADFIANRAPREQMTVSRDAGESAAALFAQERANDIRGDIRRNFGEDAKQAEKSLSFAIEAKGDPNALDVMRQKLIDSTDADPHWRKEAVDAIDWAKYHWDELQPLADRYNAITDAQVAGENAAGIDTLRRKGYVMHAQDVDESLLSGGGEPSAFKKVRTFDTFADSIANGIKPKSLNAAELLQSRINAGQRMINNRAWAAGLRDLKDAQGNPIAADPITVRRADGSTYQEAPKGYHMESFGRTPVAVRDGFDGLFHALTDPSAWSRTAAGKLAMKAAGGSKSLVLAIDTFHLGRIAFWDSLIKGLGIKTFQMPFPSYRKGVTLLDMSPEEIGRMAKAGEIPKEWLPDLMENKRRLELAVKTGFNVGRISDSLHQEWVQKVPVLGDFNKFLFHEFQRGAMAESWLLEFNRIRRARPDMPELEAARTVSKALNTRFGNLGRQGLFKSRTAQDTARTIALAPQWNEGLIRSELGAVTDAAKFVADTARGERIYAGLLLRSVGGMVAAQFAANQLINYATRGHPTWENPEEGMGAKLSAWIPDVIGNGPGFFLHPMGLAAETTHLLMNAYHRTDDWQKTLLSYMRSRASVAMRPVLTFITNTDFLGRTLKPGTVWGEMAKEVAPVPIGASGVASAAKQIATGKESETFPGQIQKQVMASAGVKTEQAPGPGQRIAKLADEYNKAQGIEREKWQGPASKYQALTQALRLGNESAARDAMQELLVKEKAADIAQHYRSWPRASFTGKRATEGGFVRSLKDEQKATYTKAQQERAKIAQKALVMLREELAKKQQSK